MYWIESSGKINYVLGRTNLLNEFRQSPNLSIYSRSQEKWVPAYEFDFQITADNLTTPFIPKGIPLSVIHRDNSLKEKDKSEKQLIDNELKVKRKRKGWIGLIRNQFDEFLPPIRKTDETGIHAKLNYHVIVESQTRKLSFLFAAIILFSITTFVVLFWFSITIDPVMSDRGIEGYTSLMYEIREAGIVEEKDLEKNTEYYWTVYYIRYLTVRVLIASVFVMVLLFLIRIYMKIREDRAITLHREEALSALQYIARGEWAYEYDQYGNYQIDPNTGSPKVIKNANIDNFSTKDLIDKLPVEILFSKPITGKEKGDKNNDLKMVQMTTSMSLLSIQMANLITNLERRQQSKKDLSKANHTADA